MNPTRITTDELVTLLGEIITAVQEEDSYDGSLEYHATEDRGMFEVVASYRFGNREHGQGFMKIVGDTAPSVDEVVPFE